MTALVLDAPMVGVLVGPPSEWLEDLRAALRAALDNGLDVAIAAAALIPALTARARGSAAVDPVLERLRGVIVRPTDIDLARLVAAVLRRVEPPARSGALLGAHTVALACELGGTILTTDPESLQRLVAPFPHVRVLAPA